LLVDPRIGVNGGQGLLFQIYIADPDEHAKERAERNIFVVSLHDLLAGRVPGLFLLPGGQRAVGLVMFAGGEVLVSGLGGVLFLGGRELGVGVLGRAARDC